MPIVKVKVKYKSEDKIPKSISPLANLFVLLTKLEPKQVLRVYGDLLTENEALILAKRLSIASALLSGDDYKAIQHRFKAAPNTVAQIHKIIRESQTQGFRLAHHFLRSRNRI